MDLFIISLERSTFRREAMLRNPLAGIRYTFVDAVDASDENRDQLTRYDASSALKWFGLPLTPGEVACFASHYALWERCAASEKSIAVMEDDVAFSPRFVEALALADELVKEHRFIRLAGQKERKHRVLRELAGGFRLVRFVKGPSGMQCYCLSPDAAKALLASADRWIEPVDNYVDSFWRHGVTPKAIVPFEAREMSRSEIESTIGKRNFPRAGWTKLRHESARARQDVARIMFNLVHRTR